VSFESRALPRFWKCFDQLPPAIQLLAHKQYALFLTNPQHRSLRLKQVGPFWSVRISRSYRALALRKQDQFVWFWIGTHREYETIIK